MAAAQSNIMIEQGATYVEKWDYLTEVLGPDLKSQDPKVFAPKDLTGCIIRMKAKSTNPPGSAEVFFWTTQGPNPIITIVDALMGRFEVFVPASVTATYTFNVAAYDMEVEFPAVAPRTEGVVKRLRKGTVTMDFEVTTGG